MKVPDPNQLFGGRSSEPEYGPDLPEGLVDETQKGVVSVFPPDPVPTESVLDVRAVTGGSRVQRPS